MADIIDTDAEQELRNIQRDYTNFFTDSTIFPDHHTYTQRIQSMIDDNQYRLIVSINDLRKKYPQRVLGLLKNSFREIECFQSALKATVEHLNVEYSKHGDFFVGFEGSFGMRHVNPRTLRSSFLGNMVCCEGIVTKCSLIRPKVVRSVHYCPNTNKTIEKQYTDLTSSDSFPTSSLYPTEDENKNPLETEFGLSVYKDHQTFSIQELPETAPAGQLPRSVDVISDNDLADRCKPGDRVIVIGVYRCLPSKKAGVTQGTFKTILVANNIQLSSKDTTPMYSEVDVTKIRQFLKNKKGVINILARSLAPSIFGHDEVKRAILCMMLGGNEKILPNGSRLRGDINILLIGDPSVAKSQLLRYVCQTAHRAVATTGRGSSGVGLTAAVTTDQETGERVLEAGAMVLGDRGIVCIDEFDKMTDIDRTAIHEVMEQGRVSISKAGIHAKLNARCSVLAAANPVYGRYDDSKTPTENIAMQDSLLSRFDLLFVLLDEHNSERDGNVAEHVIKLHKFRPAGEAEGAVLPLDGTDTQTLTTHNLDKDDKEDGDYDIYETDTQWLPQRNSQDKLLTAEFFSKYVEFAKHVKPILTDAACQFICQKYADLRSFDEKYSDKEKTTCVTPRLLETLIRLSTAFAKCRLSKKVTVEDTEMAYDLVNFACFKEKPQERKEPAENEPKKRKRQKSGDDVDGENETEDDDTEEVMPAKKNRAAPADPYSFSDREDNSDATHSYTWPQKKDGVQEVACINVQRLDSFKKCVRKIFDSKRAESLTIDEVKRELDQMPDVRNFSVSEMNAALEKMSDENSVMVSDGMIYLI